MAKNASNQPGAVAQPGGHVVTLLLVAGMLVGGTANTMLIKWQNRQCVANCDAPDPTNPRVMYEQPVWQTFLMFCGELLCWAVVSLHTRYTATRSGDSVDPLASEPLLDGPNADTDDGDMVSIDSRATRQEMRGVACTWLWLPAACDITATTLMNVGLLSVAASVYQMLRGGVVVFTGLLSMVFLAVRLPATRVFGLFAVLLGVAGVGLSSILFKDDSEAAHSADTGEEQKSPLLGVVLILVAQIFTAMQFVVEEKVLMRFNVRPAKMVGLEGVFGLLTIVVGMLVVYPTAGYGTGNLLDIWAGAQQLVGSPIILGASLGSCMSVGVFNYCGLSITGRISATSRSTIDTCRTLFVWIFSLALSWEGFMWPQVLGFAVLLYGTFVFNEVIPACPPFVTRRLADRR